MACYHPITIPVKHKTREGDRPNWFERTLPCGTCIGCRSNQARDWSIRIMHESQMHESAWFLTLTYDNERIPLYGSLHPTHLQTFFKTLRRQQPTGTVSYFACGEYGETTQRPHYHAVLFGPHLLDRYLHRDSPTSPVWRSPTLENLWPHGLSEFSTVTPGSASYVAGYVNKKLTKRQNPDAYLRVDDSTGELLEIHPEFSRMSLRPAIGKRWIEKYWNDVYPKDYVVMDGRQFRPPRFYDKWMDQNHPEIMFDVRYQRDADAQHIPEDKLQAKETIHKARNALFQHRSKI